MDKTATGAAADYLAAHRDQLAEGIEFRRHMERVAESSALVIEEDYVLQKARADGRSETVKLSKLFTDSSDSLLVDRYIFPRRTPDPTRRLENGFVTLPAANHEAGWIDPLMRR